MRVPVGVTFAACLLVGCASTSADVASPSTGSAGCTVTAPSTSSPQQETVYTIQPGTLTLEFEMSPQPSRVCPGGTVVVEMKVTNTGNAAVTGFDGRLVMGCGEPPELVVGRVGPISLPARGSVTTTAAFVVPLFAPGECGFSVYGYPHSANITVAAPNSSGSSSEAATLAAHGLKPCSEPPFTNLVGSVSDPTVSTTASLLADTHPDLFAGVWWDGAAAQYVFETLDVAAATVMLEAGLPTGTSYRVDHVARSFAELRVLRDRAMAVDVAGAFKSASPRPWDGTVNIGIGALDEATLSAIEAEFGDDPESVCVTVTGAVGL